jgi:hypothetical protein
MEAIRKLLGEAKLKEAFLALEQMSTVKEDDAFIIFKAEYTTLQRKILINTLSDKEAQMATNHLLSRLLEWLDIVELENNNSTSKPTTTPAITAACKAALTLLVYMSEQENDNTIFIRDSGKYYLRRAQGEAFINKLSDIYLAQGHGLFMPKLVRDNLYTFRSFVFRILEHAEHHNIEGEKIELIKKEIATKLTPQLRKGIQDEVKHYL